MAIQAAEKAFSKGIRKYLAELRKLSQHPEASDELSYRPIFQRFLESASKALQAEAKATFITEPKRKAFGVPDFKVVRGHSQVGYIETKGLGADLDAVMRTDQLARYRQLPNLMLTNYLEFRLIRQGTQTESVALCSVSELQSDGPVDQSATESLRCLFAAFLKESLPGVGTAEDLAKQMAWRTHLMRDAILKSRNHQGRFSDELRLLFDAFKLVLVHDLSPEQFADMYAQTVAYGLFAARHQSVQQGRLDTLTNGFSLSSAARLVPRANPLLRSLFKQLADEDMLDPTWMWHASDIADLLGASDMRKIAEDMAKKVGREDPIIHFYETFLKEYDPKIREMRGVYYTPEPVVSYIVRSVDHLIKEKFGKPDGLADKSVMILDPAVGTGTFLTGVIKHLHKVIVERGQKGTWPDFVRNNLLPRLFGFEILMAPYAVAHLKVGLLLEEQGYRFEDQERLHIYLTNTLEQVAKVSNLLAVGFAKTLVEEGRTAGEIKDKKPIMVIIGNPPYSGHSMNPSRIKVNGKWQKTWIGELIDDYKKVDGKPLGERNPKWLQDDYVKFLRFAQWRIEKTGHGIVSMITNHGYLDNPTFRGMRQSLTETFDEIHVLDLHGNVKKKEVAPDGSKDENVFDIQQGVAMCSLVHSPKGLTKRLVSHSHLWGERQKKYDWLNEHEVADTDWTDLGPKTPSYWFVPRDTRLEAEYEAGWKITDAMPVNSVGIVTARDLLTTQFSGSEMWDVLREFARMHPEEARERFRLGPDAQDWKIEAAQHDVNDGGPHPKLVLPILYRPFDTRYTYYTGRSRGLICRPRAQVMGHMLAGTNVALVSCRQHSQEDVTWALVGVADTIMESCAISNKTKEIGYIFPAYLYPNSALLSHGQNGRSYSPVEGRRSNYAREFVEEIATRLKMEFIPDERGDLTKTFGPEDVFAYIYGVFHSPTYRTRYAEFLRIDFPRVPLTLNADLFRALCEKGQELVDLHLMRDKRLSNATFWGTSYPVAGKHDVTAIEYRPPGESRKSKVLQSTIRNPQSAIERGCVYINKAEPKKGVEAEFFEDISPEVWEFRIGGYQVLHHWLKERKRHKRALALDDIEHFQKVVAVLRETVRLMAEIDVVIDARGGWPIR